MQEKSLTRRTVLYVGAGLAAASAIGWSDLAIAGAADAPSDPRGPYASAALTREFVSIGVLRSVETAAALTQFMDQHGSHATSKDLLFCPDLIAYPQSPDIKLLAATAREHNLWLAFHPSPTRQLALISVDHVDEAIETHLLSTDLGVIQTSFGNIALSFSQLVAGSAHGLKMWGAEIVLQAGGPGEHSDSGVYSVASDAIYGPRGDVLETAADGAQQLFSARIPIADFRKSRTV